MTRKYIDIRVSAISDVEISEFLKLCSKIQLLGNIGASRTIRVSVDGDGSGRLGFGVLNEKGEPTPVPTPEFKDYHERENYLESGCLNQSIGE